MSSQDITRGSVAYVRSRDAARIIGFAPDYVSSLARAGAITGRLVDNVWFVNVD
jgi:hypothetical protein